MMLMNIMVIRFFFFILSSSYHFKLGARLGWLGAFLSARFRGNTHVVVRGIHGGWVEFVIEGP